MVSWLRRIQTKTTDRRPELMTAFPIFACNKGAVEGLTGVVTSRNLARPSADGGFARGIGFTSPNARPPRVAPAVRPRVRAAPHTQLHTRARRH